MVKSLSERKRGRSSGRGLLRTRVQRAFTLVEVLIAASLLMLGALGVLAMFSTAQVQNIEARDRTRAALLAERQLAVLEQEARLWVAPQSSPPTSTRLYQIKQATEGAWLELPTSKTNWINELGLTVIDPSFDAAPRFRVAYYAITKNDFAITGAIRVIWGKPPAGACLVESFDVFDTMATVYMTAASRCDFLTLPFSFNRN